MALPSGGAIPHTRDMTTSAIQDHVSYIVIAARVGIEFGLTPEVALDKAAEAARNNAIEARTRGGVWASESSSRQIEVALFSGSVARDILDGSVSRPSTGNVRDYAINLLTKED